MFFFINDFLSFFFKHNIVGCFNFYFFNKLFINVFKKFYSNIFTLIFYFNKTSVFSGNSTLYMNIRKLSVDYSNFLLGNFKTQYIYSVRFLKKDLAILLKTNEFVI